MPISERVRKLRQQSLEARETLSSERAELLTEFMEQRAPGHTVLDGKIYHTGMLDFIPFQYRDLIVRMAGYSDYFCDLSLALQEEIIARTEHQEF